MANQKLTDRSALGAAPDSGDLFYVVDISDTTDGPHGTSKKITYANILEDKGNEVFNIKAYGAVGDGTTDDTAAIQSAITAMTSGGILYFPPGTYKTTTPLNLKSNTVLRGAGKGASIITGTYGTNARGAIEVGYNGFVSGVIIEQVTFSTSGGNAAIVIAGAKNVAIREVDFTGATTNTGTVYVQDNTGQDTSSVVISNCRFYDMANCSGVWVLSATNGQVVRDVLIEGNHFENIYTTAVHVDISGASTGTMKDIRVVNNSFIDLIGSQVNGVWALGVLAGLSSVYQVSNLLIEGNTYRNSRTGDEAQGFAWVYNATDVRIINNTAIAPATYKTNQIFVAPGRTTTPLIGLEVGGNHVEGFTAFMDFDATKYARIHHNLVYNCQGTTALGTNYNSGAIGIDIHDNVLYNSWTSVVGLEGMIQCGAASSALIACKIHDNIFIEDTATLHSKYVIQLPSVSNTDFSDLEIYNNKFYLPNNDFEAFLSRQGAGATFPRRIENNLVVQASGTFNYNSIVGNATIGKSVEKSKTYSGATLTIPPLPTPAAPTTAVVGATGSTNYTYEIVPVNGDGTDGIPSAASVAITTGNASLTTSNYNTVSWAAVDGARAYKVLRSVSSGAYQVLTLATNSLANATTTGISIKDQGQYTASAYVALTTSPGGTVVIGNVASPVATLDVSGTMRVLTASAITAGAQGDASYFLSTSTTEMGLYLDYSGTPNTNRHAMLITSRNTSGTGASLSIMDSNTSGNAAGGTLLISSVRGAGSYAMRIDNTGNSEGVHITNNTGTTGGGNNVLGYYVDSTSATTGAAFNMIWNSSAFAGIAGYGVCNMRQLNASASGNLLVLEQAGTGLALNVKSGNVSLADASNVVLGTTTGTKIGTATSQKLGIWNAAPIIQPTTGIAAATFVANTSAIANDTATFDGYTIGQVVKALRNFGLLA